MRKSLRSVKKSISKSFRSRSRTPKPKEEETEAETAVDPAVESNTIDQETGVTLDAADVVVVTSIDVGSPEDEDNSEDDECIGKSHALNAKSRMTLMCLQVALNRAPLENCRDKTEASAQVLLKKL